MNRCRQRRRSASDSSRARLEVSTTAGRSCARIVPSSGMLIWKSDSSSSRKASNSSSDLSISSISSTTLRGDGDRLEQRPFEQILARKDVLRELIPTQPLLLVGLQAQKLLLIIPFIKRARFIQTFVALQPNQFGREHFRQHLGDFGFARSRRSFDQERLFQHQGEIQRRLHPLVGDIVRAPQPLGDQVLSDFHLQSSIAEACRWSQCTVGLALQRIWWALVARQNCAFFCFDEFAVGGDERTKSKMNESMP